MIDRGTALQEPIIRLKNYVFFKETEAGVWFDAGSRSFLLKGEKIYPVVERVLTAIDSGSASRTALIHSTPDRLRPLVQQLIGALDAHGMLIETLPAEGEPNPGHTPAAEWRKFLQDQLGGAGARAAEADLTAAMVLLTGHGFALKAAARTIAHAGCRTMTLIVDRETTTVSGDEIKRSLEPGTVRVSIDHRPPCEEDVRSADLIVIAADADGDDTIGLEATRWARQHSKICIATSVRHGRGWVGPPADPDHAGLEDLVDWLGLSPPPEADASPASLAVMGGLAAHHALCQFAGVDDQTQLGRSVMVSPWLDVEIRPVTPSPRLHRDRPVQAGSTYGLAGVPAGRTLSPFETARSALAPWFDPFIGPFNIDIVKDIPQIPLYHDALAVRRPESSDETQTVIAWGLNAEEAGLRLLRSAIRAFADVADDKAYAAEFDEAAWKRAAYVEAAVRYPLFLATCRFAEVRAEDIDLPAAKSLLPLIRLFTTNAVDLRLFWSRDQDLRIAECRVGGQALSVVNHFAGDAAIVDAMGEACSRLQLRASGCDLRPSGSTPHIRPGAANPHTDWCDFLRVSGADPWPAQYTVDRRLGLPPGVWSGHAEIAKDRDPRG